RQVPVDLEPDADLNEGRGCPGHGSSSLAFLNEQVKSGRAAAQAPREQALGTKSSQQFRIATIHVGIRGMSQTSSAVPAPPRGARTPICLSENPTQLFVSVQKTSTIHIGSEFILEMRAEYEAAVKSKGMPMANSPRVILRARAHVLAWTLIL